jgi:hypothetical protein
VSLNVYHSVNLAKISRIIKMWDFIQLICILKLLWLVSEMEF